MWDGCQFHATAKFTPQEIFLILVSFRDWINLRTGKIKSNFYRESNPQPSDFYRSASTNCTTAYSITENCLLAKCTAIRRQEQRITLFSALLHIPLGSSVGIATELRSGIESRWGRDFSPVQTGPGAHPASCKMSAGSFSGVKCGRGVLLTTHPLLVPRSWKSRAIPLPTLWATPDL